MGQSQKYMKEQEDSNVIKKQKICQLIDDILVEKKSNLEETPFYTSEFLTKIYNNLAKLHKKKFYRKIEIKELFEDYRKSNAKFKANQMVVNDDPGQSSPEIDSHIQNKNDKSVEPQEQEAHSSNKKELIYQECYHDQAVVNFTMNLNSIEFWLSDYKLSD